MEKLEGQSIVKYRNPVCNTWVDESSFQALIIYNGINYYFCSIKCAKAFDGRKEKYLQSNFMYNNTNRMNHKNISFMDSHIQNKYINFLKSGGKL